MIWIQILITIVMTCLATVLLLGIGMTLLAFKEELLDGLERVIVPTAFALLAVCVLCVLSIGLWVVWTQ